MMRRYPDDFELARTADDVERIHKNGKIASLIGIEGGHSIDSSLATLRMMHRARRALHDADPQPERPWADSATDEPKLDGLSKFGEEVVREMNRLGMLVDLSHVSPGHDGGRAPRHAGAGHLLALRRHAPSANVPRNVPDDVLQLLPKNGGVVMVNFVPGFISQEVADWHAARQPQQQRLRAQFPSNDGAT